MRFKICDRFIEESEIHSYTLEEVKAEHIWAQSYFRLTIYTKGGMGQGGKATQDFQHKKEAEDIVKKLNDNCFELKGFKCE
jgi:hypothetical protein